MRSQSTLSSLKERPPLTVGLLEPREVGVSDCSGGREQKGGHSEGWTVEDCCLARVNHCISETSSGFRGGEQNMLTCWRSATLNL